METKFQASFIPKQPVDQTSTPRASGGNFLFLVSFIIFMISVAIGAAAFLYNQIVDKSISNGNQQLSLNENAFDQTTIQELTRLNDRLTAAQVLLRQHVSFSNFFPSLQRSTLKNVAFTNFTYSNGGSDKINVTMQGEAASYETVALQSKAFTDPSLKGVFHSPLFGDLNLDANGNIGFSFSMSVDPNVVSYYNLRKNPSTVSNQTQL